MKKFFCALVLAIAPLASHADWLGARGDNARTGVSNGTSNLITPEVAWRYFLGGAVPRHSLLRHDVDNKDNTDVIYLVGGTVIAKDIRGPVLWSTGPIAAKQVLDFADVDGDGDNEVIVATSNGVVFLSGANGTVEWRQPVADIGSLATAKLYDVDGDGKRELVTIACPCCSDRNDATGATYDLDGVPSLKWSPAEVRCGSETTTTILKRGSGTAVLLGKRFGFNLVDGTTGATIATSGELGQATEFSTCIAANIDSDNDDEAVCFLSSKLAISGEGHKVYALDITGGVVSLLWQKSIGDEDNALLFNQESTLDLDGDGNVEVVLSGKQASVPTLFVLDASSGTTIETKDNVNFEGVFNRDIVVSSTNDTILLRLSSASLSDIQTFPNTKVIPQESTNHVGGAISFISDFALWLTNSSLEIEAYDSDFLKMGSLQLTGNDDKVAVLSRTGDITIADGSGYIHSVTDIFRKQGLVQAGGYFADGLRRQLCKSPISGPDGTTLVSNGNGSLLLMQGGDSTLTLPPQTLWQKVRTDCPTYNLQRGTLLTRRNDESFDSLVSLEPLSGASLWERSLPGKILTDLLIGSFPTQSDTGVVVEWSQTNNAILMHSSFDVLTGLPVWELPGFSRGQTLLPSGGAMADLSGDGVSDYVGHFFSTYIIDGASGDVSDSNQGISPYNMPTIVNVDGDDQSEFFMHAGFYPLSVVDDDQQTLQTSPIENRPNTYHTLISCENDVRYGVGTGVVDKGTLHFYGLNSSSNSLAVTLAGGALYGNEAAAVAQGAALSSLGSTYGHTDIDGNGTQAILVGSQNGWLYALEPCAQTLLFALEFPGSVGAMAFIDRQDIGIEELVVSVSDGFLYGIKNFTVQSAESVIEIDPSAPTTADADIFLQSSSVRIEWIASSNAEFYEVAIVEDQTKEFVVSWTQSSNTNIVIDSLSLAPNTLYRSVVRAVASNGELSAEKESDGFVVEPSEDSSGGCGCDGSTPTSLFFIAVFLALAPKRKSL